MCERRNQSICSSRALGRRGGCLKLRALGTGADSPAASRPAFNNSRGSQLDGKRPTAPSAVPAATVVANQRNGDNPPRWRVGWTGQAGNIPALLQQSLATRPTPATVLRSAHSPFIFATDICNAPSPVFAGHSANDAKLIPFGTVAEITNYPHGL